MRLRIFVMMCLLCIKLAVAGQMKIGNNATTINSASLLELETTNKGLVFPRVSLSDISSSSPLPSGLLTGTLVYNTNSSITNGNGIGLYVWNGSIWMQVTPSISASAWSLTGNAGTNYISNFLGTTDNKSFRLRTNNIERLIIDSLGSVGIGSSVFNTTNREKLLVDYGATTSSALVSLKGNINNYLQVNFQNQSSGSNASTDYIAIADDGTDSTYYLDLGINSSTYSRTTHNWGGAHDSYLYSNSKNLLVGTATSNDLIFLTGGGVISANTLMRLKNATGNIIIGKGDNTANPVGNTIRGPNANGTNIAGGSLMLNGGVATGNATGGNLNIYGGASPSGSYGAVNINADSSSNTNINTGASTGNITLGNSSNNINVPKLSASSVVLTNASKNLTSTTPSANTYLYYNGSNFTWQSPSANSWNLTGNSGTTAGTNFLGTTDGNALVLKVNNSEAGYLGLSGSSYATALGVGSSGSSTGFQATAIGAGAQATANTSVALGYNASASIQDGIAIGNAALANTNNEGIAIGHSAGASAYQSIALGVSAAANSNNQTIAIGKSATASGYQGIAIGYNASATSNNSALAFGVSAAASGYQSTAIGNSASATAQNSTAVGNGATTTQTNALILGNSSTNVGIGTSTPNTSTKLDVNGGFKLGSSGTALANIIKTNVSISAFTISSLGTTTVKTVTVTGAVTTGSVIVNPRSGLPGGLAIAYSYISAADTVSIAFICTLLSISVPAITFDITVIQ